MRRGARARRALGGALIARDDVPVPTPLARTRTSRPDGTTSATHEGNKEKIQGPCERRTHTPARDRAQLHASFRRRPFLPLVHNEVRPDHPAHRRRRRRRDPTQARKDQTAVWRPCGASWGHRRARERSLLRLLCCCTAVACACAPTRSPGRTCTGH